VDRVIVELNGILRNQVGAKTRTVTAGLTVREAATVLGIAEAQDIMAIVNDRVTEVNYILKVGDHLMLIPSISGGGK
jgi:molybdopterin converting factor small subunit